MEILTDTDILLCKTISLRAAPDLHFMNRYCSRHAMRMESPANTHTISAANRSSLEISPAPLPASAAHSSAPPAPAPAPAASCRRSVNREAGLNGPHISWAESWHRRLAATRN
ncbi:hypothetical protein CRUP_028004, partial [Coryphaenoides rupestris]